MKFRKKPIIIEAIQYIGDWKEIMDWAAKTSDGNGTAIYYNSEDGLHVFTKEGVMKVGSMDFIICGVNGEFYPCKPDIFEKSYEPVKECA